MENNWRFNLVGLIAIGIIILREVYPDARFDGISLSLLGIAAIALALPRILEILPPIRKAKYKDFEIEFEQELSELEQKVEDLESSPSTSTTSTGIAVAALHSEYVDEYERIVSSNDANIQKVLRAAILSEKIVMQSAEDLEIEGGRNARSPSIIIKRLVQEGFISQKESAVFNSFWGIRNKVVHGEMSKVSDKQTARVMSLLWRIITIFG